MHFVMHSLRKYTALLMVAVLVLTGHSMAIARGMPGVAGYAEYCLNENAVMVPVDAEGNPTGPAHLCPDASFSLLNWVDVAPIAAIAVVMTSRPVRIEAGAVQNVIRTVQTSARSPPVFVSFL